MHIAPRQNVWEFEDMIYASLFPALSSFDLAGVNAKDQSVLLLCKQAIQSHHYRGSAGDQTMRLLVACARDVIHRLIHRCSAKSCRWLESGRLRKSTWAAVLLSPDESFGVEHLG